MFSATEETRRNAERGIVMGRKVYVDESGGQGHSWRNREIPVDVACEIEGEIVDGGHEECSDYTASNGQHYRW